MRSGRTFGSGGGGGHAGTAQGYSSSEDDEMTRLKPASGTSTSGGSSSGARRTPRANCRNQSHSEGATSPNESDNTYAEASLLHNPNRPIRYADMGGYDSEIYANDQLVNNGGKYTPRSPPISLGTNNSRYLGNGKNDSSTTKSPFLNRNTNTKSRKMDLPPPPLPAANATRPRQMALNEAAVAAAAAARGWDNGIGGYQTNSMLETRIGGTSNGQHVTHEDYMKLGHFTTMMGDRRNRQPAFGAKTASLHRRSLSDDSLKASHPNSPSQLVQSQPQDPIVMPGFPVRTLQAHPPPPYSPTREKFLLGKRCHFHCSWKLVALSLTVLTLILSSVICYFGAVKFPGTQSSHHPVRTGGSSQNSAVISAASSSVSNGLECPPALQEQPQAVIPQGYTPDYVSTYATSQGPPSLRKWPPQTAIQVVPGQWYTSSVDPLEMWLSQMHVPHANTNLQMNLTVVNGHVASIAVYGRREAPPSITNYDWVHMVAKDGRVIIKRSSGGSTGLSLEKVLLHRGDWYFGVLNDNDDVISLRAVFDQQRNGGKPCPNDCNGQGRCQDGQCQCYQQYSGHDCSQSICPLLCSGHGVYGGGRCHCVDGWKGAECDVRDTECVIADCSKHGRCREGVCICNPGWTGEHCQTRHCQDPTCNGRGSCQDAACVCDIGWMGPNCERRNEALYQCLPDCTGHGIFNADLGKCECHSKWTGRECNITVCGLDCGPHGQCLGSSCVCYPGWQGPRCNLRACDERCKEHGQCINGTCVCQRGFNGKHCSIDACGGPRCNDHGVCENMAERDQDRPDYECQCNPGWTGDHCHIPEETECEDEIDNDNNGLTDCSDSKCCSHPSCRTNIMCMYLEDPVEVLLRKPPPAVDAPFLKRVQFLFEGEDSVQNYAKQDTFDDRRVSIIRGRVVTMTGQGIIGVRVSAKDANNYGFTLTRPEGWFDLAVNGGGGVTLQFQRSPLKATTRTLYLPWNRIVVINPVIMTPNGGAGISWSEEDTASKVKYTQPCLSHDYHDSHSRPQPFILSSYTPSLASSSAKSRPGIIAELGEVQESLRIPGTRNLHLVYRSASARGAFSTVDMVLTGEKIAVPALKWVHVIVRVAGKVYREKLEPEPMLRYTFSWDKTNIYNQKVYGLVEAEVSIGYDYADCAHVLWTAQMVKIKGFQVDISNVGGWNLNIHHHYNPHEGVLQKGDGSVMELKSLFPRLVRQFVGSQNRKREFECKEEECNVNEPSQARLLNVVSVASGPDGSLFIGDFNLVRRVTPQGEVFTVLQFEDSLRDFDYDLCVSPKDGKLYLSHAKKHQVWSIKSLQRKEIRNPSANWEIAVGTGDRCVPGDECGDNGPALKAKLNYPKGLAIAIDGTMYISDSRNIRVVTPEAIIQTLIGTQERPQGPPRPLPCAQTFLASQVQLQWPTKLALNPLDSSLHIVDDTMILKLTSDMRLVVEAGISPICTARQHNITHSGILSPITDLDFAHDGTMYFVEKNKKSVIHQLDRFGTVQPLEYLHHDNASTPSRGGTFSALSVSPSGKILVAENEKLEILSIEHVLPEKDSKGEIKVADPLSGTFHTFNRFNQHIATSDLETGTKLYSFIYTKNTALGKLSDIVDGVGNTLSIKRDFAGKVQSIDNTLGQKHPILLTPMGLLKAIDIMEEGAEEIVIDYDDTEGLLTSIRKTNGEFRTYAYDLHGGVTRASSSTGLTVELQLEACLDNPSHCLRVTANGLLIQELRVSQSGKVEERRRLLKKSTKNGCDGASAFDSSGLQDWSFIGELCSHLRLRASTAHPTLMTSVLNFGKPTSQRLSLGEGGEEASNLLTWTYKSEGNRLTKQLQFGSSGISGGNQLFGVHYDAISHEEAFFNGQGQRLLSIKYKNGLLPAQWTSGLEPNCTQTFDRLHRMVERSCGQVVESFGYNEHNGRLEETRRSCQRRPTKFTYAKPNSQRPREVVLPSGKRFSFDYDNNGGLSTIRLPGGNSMIRTSLQSGILGVSKVYLSLPGLSDPYVTYWHQDKLLQVRTPSGNGNVLYKYDGELKLLKTASGDSLSLYQYSPNQLLTGVTHNHKEAFSMKNTYVHSPVELSSNEVRLLELRIDFEATAMRLANAKFDYVYDPSLINPILQGRIGGKALPDYYVHHGWSSTELRNGPKIGQFVVHPHDLNVTSITDGVASFTQSSNLDVLSIQGREIFRAEWILDACGKISASHFRMIKGTEFRQTWKYLYDDDGQLESAGIVDNTEWRYKYDILGNLVTVATSGITGRSTHKLNFDYDKNGFFSGPKVRYDENGHVISHIKGLEMGYNSRGHLAKVKLARSTIEYFYDHRGRLISRKSSSGLTQFFYGYEGKPHLLSHLYKPHEGSLTTLVYGPDDRLIFMAQDAKEYYVVTDRLGSPLLLLTPEGLVVKEMTRTPYGELTYDSNQSLEVPLGFQGGLFDSLLNLVHFQDGPEGSHAYDPFTGTFLTPQWRNILNKDLLPLAEDATFYSLYRYPRNDPINSAKFNPFADPQERLREHLKFAQPIAFDPFAKLGHLGSQENHLLQVVAESNFQQVLNQMTALSSVPKSALTIDFPSPAMSKWSRLTSPLGKFVALSLDNKGNIAKIRSIEAGSSNEVPRDVFQRVLDEAALALNIQHGTIDAYYFVKENIYEASSDVKTLRRLGPNVNLTSHDSQSSTGIVVMDVKVHLENTIVSIRYGSSIEAERIRILRHASKVTARRAWTRQKELLSQNRAFEAEAWSPRQKDQILLQGSVSNYEVRFARDLEEFPELAADLANVKFVPIDRKNNP